MTETQSTKSTRERSPSFPFIPLRAAIERLEQFADKFGRQEVPADRVYLAWRMKGDTSQAQQTLAALKSYGLIEYKGSGPKRPVILTDDARTYLRAQQESVKEQVLKRLGLRPKWIRHFWERWGGDSIPDEVRLDSLVLEHKFNENSAPTFLRVYDETIAFAGLSDSDKIVGATVDGEDELPPPVINVGDLVQVEFNGAYQLGKPQRVRAVQNHEGQKWVFIEGSETGILMDQVQVLERDSGTGQNPLGATPPRLADPKPGMKEEKNSLDEGEAVLIWPENLSQESVHDLEYWLEGILRKAKRRAGIKEEKPKDEAAD